MISCKRVAVLTLSICLCAAAGRVVAADWPCFRGPHRDGICQESGLLKAWPEEGPKLLWSTRELGAGFSGPAIVGNMLYTMGERDGAEWVIALNCAEKGQVVWATPIGPVRHNGGGQPGPRSTPAVHRGKVYTLGINGDLVCLDAMTGQGIWHHNVVTDYGGEIPKWGYSESVLIDGRWLLCTPGGAQATVIALWRLNGEKVWVCPAGDAAAYSSIIKVSIAEQKQYVQFTEKGVIAVRERGGRLLWRYDKPANETANVATPLWYGQTVFAASGYGKGGGCVWAKMTPQGEFAAEEMYFTKEMQNHHGGMILWDEHVYGCNNPDVLTCLEYKTGKTKWTDKTSGKCSLLFADGMLIARSEKGPISLVEATSEAFRLRGRFDQPYRTRRPAWSHPVISGGRLFIRDQSLLLCYDLRPGSLDEEADEKDDRRRFRRSRTRRD
ncbi:MAG: outer membrane protein assembly factor BamB family protein [Planctomycetota bacterium]